MMFAHDSPSRHRHFYGDLHFLLFRISAAVCVAILVVCGLQSNAFAAERGEAPDGAPTLAREISVSEKTAPADAKRESVTSVIESEERVQGQLASTRVRSGANSYLIVDPKVGRTDRAETNGQKRVSPSRWELLRF